MSELEELSKKLTNLRQEQTRINKRLRENTGSPHYKTLETEENSRREKRALRIRTQIKEIRNEILNLKLDTQLSTEELNSLKSALNAEHVHLTITNTNNEHNKTEVKRITEKISEISNLIISKKRRKTLETFIELTTKNEKEMANKADSNPKNNPTKESEEAERIRLEEERIMNEFKRQRTNISHSPNIKQSESFIESQQYNPLFPEMPEIPEGINLDSFQKAPPIPNTTEQVPKNCPEQTPLSTGTIPKQAQTQTENQIPPTTTKNPQNPQTNKPTQQSERTTHSTQFEIPPTFQHTKQTGKTAHSSQFGTPPTNQSIPKTNPHINTHSQDYTSHDTITYPIYPEQTNTQGMRFKNYIPTPQRAPQHLNMAPRRLAPTVTFSDEITSQNEENYNMSSRIPQNHSNDDSFNSVQAYHGDSYPQQHSRANYAQHRPQIARESYLRRLRYMPKFTGESFKELKDFIDIAETLYFSASNEIEENEFFEQMLLQLRGEPRTLIAGLQNANWGTIKELLLNKFSYLSNKKILQSQLENIKQERNESVAQYADRTRKLLKERNSTMSSMSEDLRLEYNRQARISFTRGLKDPKLQDRLKTRGAQSLEDAAAYAIEADNDTQNTIPNIELFCTACRRNGHRERNCMRKNYNNTNLNGLLSALRANNINPNNYRQQNPEQIKQNERPNWYQNERPNWRQNDRPMGQPQQRQNQNQVANNARPNNGRQNQNNSYKRNAHFEKDSEIQPEEEISEEETYETIDSEEEFETSDSEN